MAAARRPPSSDPGRSSYDGDRDAAQRALGGAVRRAQAAIIEETEAAPVVEAVANSLCSLAVGRQLRLLRMQPHLEFSGERPGVFGTHALSFRRLLAV